MKIPIGYKFIIGFICVIAGVAFIPNLVDLTDIPEWLKQPISFLAAIVIGLVIGISFTKDFTRNFNILTGLAQRISKGDLAASNEIKKPVYFSDETSDLEAAIVQMSGSLRSLVQHMRETVLNLTEAEEVFSAVVSRGHETSKEVISGTAVIFAGAIEQSNHIGEAFSTVKSLSELADDVANKVTESANSSQKVNFMVQRGANAATSAMEKMETIFKGIEKTEGAAARLKEKLNDIPKILDVITHISRQTDLLALNATIEASKAGEHGRGFAMVAEEVRRFADNTNQSVQDVSFIVKELKMDVEHVVATAGEGTSNLKGGRDDIRKIREILTDITDYTSDVAEKSTLILGLTHRQKEKAGKTTQTIAMVADIARQNLKTTDEVEAVIERHKTAIRDTLAAAERLTTLSRELKTVVSKFNLS